MKIELLEPHTDPRGTLVEAFTPISGQIHYIIINPNQTRGNHYHKRKIEKFIIVSGQATFGVRDKNTGETWYVEGVADTPKRITIYPEQVHNIVAGDEGAVVISWCSEVFDKDDQDFYPEVV